MAVSQIIVPKELPFSRIISGESVRVGDSVVVRFSESEALVFALVRSIKPTSEGDEIKVKRYYRPEDTIAGRHSFYGNKELLLTNHLDTLQPASILHKIHVHSFVEYIKLDTPGARDFFSRFEYDIDSGWLSPAAIEVFCKCKMPFNPDLFTLKCEACKEPYHPACINMTLDLAKQLVDNFTCDYCPALLKPGSTSVSVDPSMVEHKRARR